MKKVIFEGSHGPMSYVYEPAQADFATLVFLAGQGNRDTYLWMKGIGQSLDARFGKLYVNLLGHATSGEATAARTLENQTFELHELIEKVAKTPVIFFAHSMGAVLADSYINTYPESVRGMIAVEPTGCDSDKWWATPEYVKIQEKLATLPPEQLYQMANDSDWTDEELAQIAAQDNQDFAEDSTMAQEVALFDENFTKFAALLNLNLPTLLIFQPFREAEYRASEFASSQTTFLALEGNHYLHIGQAEAVAKASNQFLSALTEPFYEKALRKIATKLAGTGLEWYVMGSVSDAIQGVKIQPHDLDIAVHTRDFARAQEIFAQEIVAASAKISTEKNIQQSFQIRLGQEQDEIDVIADPARDAENRRYQKIN